MPTSGETSEIESLTTAVDGRPHNVGVQTEWRIHPAFFGAGTMLIGPAADRSGRTWAIIPPGAWAREAPPQDWSGASRNSKFERHGWRKAEWAAHRLIDDQSPTSVEALSLNEVVDLVSALAPHASHWVEHTVIDQIHVLETGPIGLTRTDEQARVADLAYAAMLRLTAETALGRDLSASHIPSLDDALREVGGEKPDPSQHH